MDRGFTGDSGHPCLEALVNNFNTLVPNMALEFPFELDNFQKEAIYYLEKRESVFISAHTSAGKTVVAEYAFALASKHHKRAIYTAPIKTISNQKYRDFCGKFDVGLITGDVRIKPEASCLIVTTEILRSMLYKEANIIDDIEWVILDEVHYVNDVERGVVWEEIIIMLPRHVNIVLLSATVPNTSDFADWIFHATKKKIHVIRTLKRPVPLEHCLFYSGELYKVCEDDVFMPQGYQSAKDVHMKQNLSSVRGRTKKYQKSCEGFAESSGISQNKPEPWSDSTSWPFLINKLSGMSHLPVIIFCFSKNRFDKLVDTMIGIDLTSNSEKSQIRTFCRKAFTCLKGPDRNLPQVLKIESLLERGFAVHHAGLLPIVKEAVEMLFCRGLIKILFSTETFAMGVNAPARTVVFDTLRKFDGKGFRQLLPSEYIQMAGRAGRRGLDKVGTVIVTCRDGIPDENLLRNVLVGMPTRLESKFRLTYIMILRILRQELKVEDMLKKSFAEFYAQKKLSEIQLRLSKLSQSAEVIELKENMALVKEQKKHKEEVNALKYQMSDEALQQMPDFQGRIDVLKEIGCIDSDLVVQVKGYVACEMSSGEELICTECLFDNQFEDLEPEEAVALMSAFVFQRNNVSEQALPPKLSNAMKRLSDTASRLGHLQAQFNVAVDPEKYVQDNIKFGLVQVVYEWAKGSTFDEICKMTEVPEGMIVRTIVRLNETCRQFKNAALIMGNSELHKKMETASHAIKRGIISTASLFVTGVE